MMNIKMIQEQIDKYMIKEFTEPTWNKIKVKMKQGLIFLFATFVFLLPNSESIADKNAVVSKAFVEAIPHIMVLGGNKSLKDTLLISDGRVEGRVIAFAGDLFAKMEEKAIVEYYNEKLINLDWHFIGSYYNTEDIFSRGAEKCYLWKNSDYFIILYFVPLKLKYYTDYGNYEDKEGLKYGINMGMTNSEFYKDAIQCLHKKA